MVSFTVSTPSVVIVREERARGAHAYRWPDTRPIPLTGYFPEITVHECQCIRSCRALIIVILILVDCIAIVCSRIVAKIAGSA